MDKVEATLGALSGILIAFCFVLMVFGFVGCVASFKEHTRLQEEMRVDDCKSVSKVETGKTIYCGKACWRKEMREEFICKSGVKVIVE